MADFNHSTENRLFIIIAIVAVALLLPVWTRIDQAGSGYERALAIAGFLATIATMYGTVSASDGWNLRSIVFYIPWSLFGALSCALLVIGVFRTPSPWWKAGLGVVAVLQLMAICLPAILWLIDKRDSETGPDQ